MKVEYIIPELDEKYPDDAWTLNKIPSILDYIGHEFDSRNQIIAEHCAEHWFYQTGMLESQKFPLVIKVFVNDESIGQYEVEIETVPKFYAEKVK